MRIPDVNVLVYAFRRDLPEHSDHVAWLERWLSGVEPLGVSELALSGLVRLVTNRRIFREPSSVETALAFCDAVLGAPSAVPVRPGPRHWTIFTGLCRATHATANLVPDAYHAATAIENGATWVSNDRGFARFPGLRWTTPAEDG